MEKSQSGFEPITLHSQVKCSNRYVIMSLIFLD
jgi:hypothetical protein